MSPVKSNAALMLGALLMMAGMSQAATTHAVTCENGRTVQATDSETAVEACLKVGSRPTAASKADHDKWIELASVSHRNKAKAQKFQQLAAQHKPRTAQQEKLVKEYMKLPPGQRAAFKAQNPTVQKSIWDYGPYAVCFYASVAGGADVVEAGEECHEDWVN